MIAAIPQKFLQLKSSANHRVINTPIPINVISTMANILRFVIWFPANTLIYKTHSPMVRPIKVAFILSNPNSFVEKVEWVKEYLPNVYKNVIFSHHKDLNRGDYLIDDSIKNGAAKFIGEHIQIHSDKFPAWNDVMTYIFNKENL